jgi:hypothetical protein
MVVFGARDAFPLRPGVDVEVRCRFDDHWARGFEIASVEDDSYRLRRRSDGSVLPATFRPGDLRPRRV